MIASDIINPYGLDPRLDYPQAPHDEENWTEYRYLFGYDPKTQMGINIHIGRIVEDRNIWRGMLYVFLPNEEVLVRKCSGRDGGPYHLGAGPLSINIVEPMQLLTIEFDGLMTRTNRKALAREVGKDGPDELVKFQVILDAAAPVAILRPTVMKGLEWSHYHTEQIHSMRGEITYQGKTTALTGVGARDHSSGPRNSGGAIGAFWANILFENGVALNVNIARTQKFEINTGYVYWGDGSALEEIEVLSVPPFNDANTQSGSVHCDVVDDMPTFEMSVRTSRGDKTIKVERLTSVSSTYIAPSSEMAGTDLTRPDGAQMTKIPARFTMDGVQGHGQLDRYSRIHTLYNPDAA